MDLRLWFWDQTRVHWVEKSTLTQTKNARQDRNNLKSMIITFSDWEGMFHREFIPQGGKVNQLYYLYVLRLLWENVRWKRPHLWEAHHDNGPAHTAFSVRQFLARNKMTLIHHPPTQRTWHRLTSFCSYGWQRCRKDADLRAFMKLRPNRRRHLSRRRNLKIARSMFSKLAEALGSLYRCRRELLWREQHLII